ncbi:hypothetical protein [Xanthobacter sediminis]|uniref:hypothetical protein n=1 Tax=Xanthobacter sediminis TaxID=3119926 RepID=UPI0037276EC4
MSLPVTSAALSLRRAIPAVLCADATLLGGPRVHDVSPRDADFLLLAQGDGDPELDRVQLDFTPGRAPTAKEVP